MATRLISSPRYQAALQGGVAARVAALLRRSGRLLRLRRGAPDRAEASEDAQDRGHRHPRHTAAAMRGACRHRQPVRPPVPNRLRRSSAQPEAFSISPSADLPNWAISCNYSVTAPAVKRGAIARCRARVREEPTTSPRCCKRQGVHRGRRHDAGAGGPAPAQALHRKSPLSLYRALRSLNPSPYMYFYDMGDFQIVGASPGNSGAPGACRPKVDKVTIRPLAGTRAARRHARAGQGARSRTRQSDPKERAEHVMLIDLARNDIGRIAKTGSVKVTEAFHGGALQRT